jgi:hypothetical protein
MKRRKEHTPIIEGNYVMVMADQFATMTGRSKKLGPRWRGPFKILAYDNFTENYTVAMESRIYRREMGVFHCSVIKPYHQNDDNRFPGRAHKRPAAILVHEKPEWEVELILDHRRNYGKNQFLVKWVGYPDSENSWEPLEGLENSMELVDEWWKINMPGEELQIEANFITVCWSPTNPQVIRMDDEPQADDGFWAPHLESDYNSSGDEEFRATEEEERTMWHTAQQFQIWEDGDKKKN